MPISNLAVKLWGECAIWEVYHRLAPPQARIQEIAEIRVKNPSQPSQARPRGEAITGKAILLLSGGAETLFGFRMAQPAQRLGVQIALYIHRRAEQGVQHIAVILKKITAHFFRCGPSGLIFSD